MTDRPTHRSRPPRDREVGADGVGESTGRRATRRPPADAVAVAAVVALVWASVTRLSPGSALATAIAAAFVLVVPGYALAAALFPGNRRTEAGGLGGPERVAYALALSLVAAALVALALGGTGVGIRPRPVVLALGAASLGAMVVATLERGRLPSAERFAPWPALRARDPDWLVLGVVAVAVVAAVGAAGYTAARPPAETFSALYLLSSGDDGGLVAAVPSSVAADESLPLVVGVDNREGRTATYTVVAVAARVDDAGRPVTAAEVGRWRAAVAAGDTWRLPHEVTVPAAVAGDGVDADSRADVRLAYYLFVDGSVPAPARVGAVDADALDAADYEVHVWLDVGPGR